MTMLDLYSLDNQQPKGCCICGGLQGGLLVSYFNYRRRGFARMHTCDISNKLASFYLRWTFPCEIKFKVGLELRRRRRSLYIYQIHANQ
jgi:hypothetical protein